MGNPNGRHVDQQQRCSHAAASRRCRTTAGIPRCRQDDSREATLSRLAPGPRQQGSHAVLPGRRDADVISDGRGVGWRRRSVMPVRVVLERGPKAKKFVAYAGDWPGWSRGSTTADGAFKTLAAYRERYQPVAVRAGLGPEFDEAGPLDVVEDRVGTGSTDFWGISFAPSSL